MHETRTDAADRGWVNHHGLIALNLVLLLLLAAVTFAPRAEAQQRPRGDFNMVAGGVNGSNTGAVYILDENNQEVMAVTYDDNAKRIKGIGYRNLAADEVSLIRSRK